jgi:hypothetical protein
VLLLNIFPAHTYPGTIKNRTDKSTIILSSLNLSYPCGLTL